MGRGEAAKATPRIRNKITNKTRLSIIHGDIDADRLFIEDVDGSDGKNLASGVDAEDANEYHLQAILSASTIPAPPTSSTFCQPSVTSRKGTSAAVSSPPSAPPPPSLLHIPTPDATGKVANYTDLYTAGRWEPPKTLLKFSATVEESAHDSLANGYTYVMDERDAEWLEKNNKLAKGEGPSNGNLTRPESTPIRRSAKARGKEPESPSTVVITEDEFELVMGLFEKFVDEKVPFLHLALNDFPPYSDFEASFSSPLPSHYFPNYLVPHTISSPAQLSRFSRIIYPHWRERRSEREGRRIIPPLNFDESNEGDPYVCFRRREVKPVRKTRRQDTTSLDRMIRLKSELDQAYEIARLVLDREQEKVNVATEFRVLSESRARTVELKRRHAVLAAVVDDDLFVERSVKKAKLGEAGVAAGMIKIRRHRDSLEGGQSGQATPSEPPNPFHRATIISQAIEGALLRNRNIHWEDVSDSAFQPPSLPLAQRHFRSLPDSDSILPPPVTLPYPPSTTPPPTRTGRSISYRTRLGRGGRLMLDRRLPAVRHPLDMPYKLRHEVLTQAYLSRPSKYPDSGTSQPESGEESSEEIAVKQAAELQEKAWKTEERWRYDSDSGIPIGGGLVGVCPEDEDDQRLIVDDFDPTRSWHIRKMLLTEDDMVIHTRIDELQFRKADAAYEARQEAAKKTGMGAELAEKLRKEQISRGSQASLPSSSPSNSSPIVALPPSSAGLLQSPTNGNTPITPNLVKKVQRPLQLQLTTNPVTRLPNSVTPYMAPGLGAATQLPSETNLKPQSSSNMSTTPISAHSQALSPAIPSTLNAPASTGANGISGAMSNTIKLAQNGGNGPQGSSLSPTPAQQSQALTDHSPVVPSASPRPRSQTATHVNGIANGIASNSIGFSGSGSTLVANFPNGSVFPLGLGLRHSLTHALTGSTGVSTGVNGNSGLLNSQQAMGLKGVFPSLNPSNSVLSQSLQLQQQGMQGQISPTTQLQPGFGAPANANAVNGFNNISNATLANLNLAIGNGNIPLKLPAQRQMQLAAGQRPAIGPPTNGIVVGSNTTADGSPVMSSAIPSSLHMNHPPVGGRGSPRLATAVASQLGRGSPNGIVPHHGQSRASASPLTQPQLPHSSSPLGPHSNLTSPAHQHQQVVGGPALAFGNAY